MDFSPVPGCPERPENLRADHFGGPPEVQRSRHHRLQQRQRLCGQPRQGLR